MTLLSHEFWKMVTFRTLCIIMTGQCFITLAKQESKKFLIWRWWQNRYKKVKPMWKAWTKSQIYITGVYLEKGSSASESVAGVWNALGKLSSRVSDWRSVIYKEIPGPCQFEKVMPFTFCSGYFLIIFTWEKLFPWESQNYNFNLGKISK